MDDVKVNASFGLKMRHALRYFMPYMTPYEWMTYGWIVERTLSFNKLQEIITAKDFSQGIWWGGKCQIRPLTLSESSRKRAIKGLCDKGFIFRKSRERDPKVLYVVNPEWRSGVTQTPPWGHTDPSLSNNTCIHNTGCAPALTRETAIAATENVTELENATECNMSVDAVAALRGVVDATTENTRQRRDRIKKKLNATGLQKIWDDAFSKSYPERKTFAWKKYEIAGFKRAIDRGVDVAVAEEFVIFMIEHFANVIAGYFSWMKSPPQVPDVSFAIKNIAKFHEAFEDFIDPNRGLKGRVARAPKREAVVKPAIPDAEVEALKAENSKLKEIISGHAEDKIAKRSIGTKAARKLVTHRATSSDEFGSWDAKPGRTRIAVRPLKRR